MSFYANENYGMVISLCKKESKYFDSSQFKIKKHTDKQRIKNKFDKIQVEYEKEGCLIRDIVECLFANGFIPEAVKNDFEESRLRVHYVAVSLSAQHKKIAQAMLTKLCMMYDKIPGKYPLYLATQSQSYGAIKLYSRLGFTPYLGAYKGCTEQKSKNAWQNVTEILRCKA